MHQRTRPLVAILDSVLSIAMDTPPVDNKMSRFGNPAFKTFYDRVGEVGDGANSAYLRRPLVYMP